MEQNILASGLMGKLMAKALKHYQTELFMTVIGLMESLIKENANILMERSTKDNGKMESHLVMVLKLGQMEESMMVSGGWANLQELALKSTQMVDQKKDTGTKESSLKEVI